MSLNKGNKKIVLMTKIPPVLAEKTITQNGTYLASDDNAEGYDKVSIRVESASGTKDIYFANIAASNDNWFEEANLKPVLQYAYDEGYHDILVNTLNGTRYTICTGVDIQELNTNAVNLQFVSLSNTMVSTDNPTRIATDGVLVSGVKLDENNKIIMGTAERAEIQYIDVMTENATIDGGTWS